MDERGAYQLQRDVERRRERLWLPRGVESIFQHEFSDHSLEQMANVADELGAHAYSGGWVQMANYATTVTAASAVGSFTTVTTIVSPFPDLFLPANSLHVGTRLRMRCWGSIQSAAGTATFTLGAYVGASAGAGNGGTAISSGVAGTPATGPLPWMMQYEATVQVIGAASTAQIIGQGFSMGAASAVATITPLPATAPTALATVFTTQAASLIVPGSVCSVSNASNAFIAYGFSVEQLN